MNDRFKFRAVLKTDTHSIITEPHYIFDNGYLINIDDVQKPFEKKYPDDCFWEFIEEIEKQENCQEVSTDSEIIIFDSFDGLIQSTGLKDKNGKLIYEGDVVKFGEFYNNEWHSFDIGKVYWGGKFDYPAFELQCSTADFDMSNGLSYIFGNGLNIEVIGNIYTDAHLLQECK